MYNAPSMALPGMGAFEEPSSLLCISSQTIPTVLFNPTSHNFTSRSTSDSVSILEEATASRSQPGMLVK